MTALPPLTCPLSPVQCPQLRDLVGTANELHSPFPRFALSDPRVYVICVAGRPRLQSCGAMDTFDPDRLACTRPSSFLG